MDAQEHRRARSPTYIRWKAAKQRCHNPNATNYAYYGGRGIKVCAAWRNSFEAFLADMGECPDQHSLDRIDPDGDYEASNCRWATQAEQVRNFRDRNVFVMHEGERMVLKDYCALIGVSYGAVQHRRAAGQSVEQAIEAIRYRRASGERRRAPIKKRRFLFERITPQQLEAIRNDPRIAREIAKSYDLSMAAVYRIKAGEIAKLRPINSARREAADHAAKGSASPP